MPVTGLRGRQVLDGDITRSDINTSTAGSALIARIIAGTNISITSTGADSGTGDVTISATGTGLNGTGFVRMNGAEVSYITGTAAQFVKANGTLDSSVYLTSYTETDTLATVTGRGATTTTLSNFNGGINMTGATSSTGLNITSSINSGSGSVIRIAKAAAANQAYISFDTDQLFFGTPSNNTTDADVGTKGSVNLRLQTNYTTRINIGPTGTIRLVPLTSNGFLKTSGGDGTLTVDTATYLTGNQSITLSGDATGSGATAITVTLANSGVAAGTYTKVTVDAKGRVTTGASLLAADIPALNYLPIGGGTLTGNVIVWPGSNASYGAGFKFRNDTYAHYSIGVKGSSFVLSNTGSDGTVVWPVSITDLITVGTSGNTVIAGTVTASSIIRSGGTSSQFLKADGSVDSTTYQSTSQKGQANGYASLDGAGKVPIAQLPSSIMEYKGTWNASTNSPSLADGTGDTGDVYRVSTAGTRNLGSGSITFDVGDYVIYNGTIWEKSDTTDAVASVNGLTGVITLTTTNIAEGTNLYYTDARARAAITLTTTGTSGAATYSGGVLNIPQYQPAGSYLTAESDTLATVTGRGATTSTQVILNGGIRMGNAYLNPSGDLNHFHFNGTAIIPNTTTTASNASMGTASYRWSNLYGGGLDLSGSATISGNVTAAKYIVGSALGTSPIVVNGSANESQVLIKKSSQSSFSVLTWDGNIFLASNIYYSAGAWVHSAPASNNNNQLFAFTPGTGVTWYASNNGSGSWNVSNNITLWNDSGVWQRPVSSVSGTANYISKFTSTTAVGNSQLYDDGTTVGVGTSTVYSWAKLQVAGTLAVGGILYIDDDYRIQGLSAFPGAASKLILNSDGGNVGIGTTDPASKLHVTGATDSNPTISIGTINANTGNAEIDFYSGTAGSNNSFTLRYTKTSSVDRIGFIDGGAIESFVILNGGNVGIGTITPTDKLSISGSTNAALGVRILNSTNNTAANSYLSVGPAGSSVNIISYPSNATARASTVLINTDSSVANGLLFTTDAGPIRFSSASGTGTQMHLNSSGNLGVGTSTPGYRLHVLDSANFGTIAIGNVTYPTLLTSNAGSGEFRIDNRSSTASGFISFYPNGQATTLGDEAMRITTGRSLLIGATSQGYNPQTQGYLLGVKSNTTQAFISVAKSGQTLDSGGIIYGLDTTTGYAWVRENIDFTIGTNNTEKVRITAAGNVYTAAGSAISYGSGETYQIWNSEPQFGIAHSDANWKDMKTFKPSKSGSLKFKFSAYISSGTYYWAWRIRLNGTSTVASGHYNSGLDTGEVTSVHAYRRFVASVGPIAAGDSLVLQMISSDGSGNPTTGNGQTLYAKEFRAYSTVPNLEHGGSTNIWGDYVGIGTLTPTRTLHVISSDWDNNGGGGVIFQNSNTVGSGLTLIPTASAVTNGASGWAMYAGGPGAAIGDGNLGFWAHGTNAARLFIRRNGQIAFTAYTASGSFSGTAAGLLGFDSSGNVISIGTGTYLTAESDTLATVTGRGATTSSAVTFNGNVSVGTSASLSFGSQTRQMINLWSTGYGIGVQSSTTYFRSDSRFSWHRGGSHNDAENNPGGGTVAMTLDSSSNLAVTGTLTASSIIRSGGTASQFLKANGSVDSNTYITSASVGNGTLTLAVSGTGLSGSASFTANQSGNTTFTVTSNATSANTASAIVARDASGNFSAGAITSSALYGTSYTTLTSGAGTGTAVYDTITTSGSKLYNVVISGNPNGGGSGSYLDWIYGKLIIGGGYDGTNVVNYIEFVQESPMPRTLFGSGGGDLTVDVKFVQSGTEYDSIGIGGTYTIRFKISGYNSSYTGTSTTINLLQIG